MTKTKGLSKFPVNTNQEACAASAYYVSNNVERRRENFQPSEDNTLLHKICQDYVRRLNDLALMPYTHPSKLSKLSTEKIIEMFVQANPRNLNYKWVVECEDGVNSI